MSYELTGKIKVIQDPQIFSSGFTKREMVVTVDDGKYPQDINLEFVQDKVSLLDALQIGQEVTVSFNIRGREHNGRYYNNLQGWKIQAAQSDNNSDYADYEQQAAHSNHNPFDQDDVPF